MLTKVMRYIPAKEKTMSKLLLFTAIDTSCTRQEQLKKRRTLGFKRTEYKELTPYILYACYQKEETLIRTYFFKEHLILFVEVTPYSHEFATLFDGSLSSMDVYLTDLSPEVVIPTFEKIIAEKGQGYTEIPMCHVYGQRWWHDEALIVGNRTALKGLRDAIDKAIQYGESRVDVSSSDGEGYDLYISCLEGETENNPRWEAIKLPYHDKETYVPDEENELDPFQLLKSYKDLLKR